MPAGTQFFVRRGVSLMRLGAVLIAVLVALSPKSLPAGAHLTSFTVDPGPAKTAAPKTLPMSQAPSPPSGSEFCGIVGSTDFLFADGFQGTTPTLNYLYSTRTVTGSTPTLSITYPTGTVPTTTTPVYGTYTGPADTGITVNGIKAYTTGGKFYVPVVGLGSGPNTLETTAITLDGLSTTIGPSVTQSGAVPAVQLKSALTTNFAPASIAFTAQVASGVTVSQIKMDYDGDGNDDFTTTNPTAALSYNYAIPGLYTARLTLTDNTTTPNPTTYVAYLAVFIQDLVEVRETLCSVFGYLRTSLTAGSVSQAVLVFAPDQQANYQTFYNSISPANLPVAATRMGVIANGLINNDFAQLKVVKPYQGVMTSFGVNFSRDEYGIWRIDAL